MKLIITILSDVCYFLKFTFWIAFMLSVPKAIHVFQQESYHIRDYVRWIFNNPKKAFGPGFKQFVICLLYSIVNIVIDIFVVKIGLNEVNKGLIYLI